MAITGNMEKHIQTTIHLIVVGLVFWVAHSTQNTSVEIAKISVQIRNIDVRIADMKMQMQNRYTSIDAQRDFSIIEKKLDDFEKRFRNLEDSRD